MFSTIVIYIVSRHGRVFLCILNSFTIVSVSIHLLDIERQAKWNNLNLQLNLLSIKLGEVHTPEFRTSAIGWTNWAFLMAGRDKIKDKQNYLRASFRCIKRIRLRTPGKDLEVFERDYYIPVRSGVTFARVYFGE
jgi:hypothetical protein